MVFVLVCLLIFIAAYLIIRLAARRCGAFRLWKLLAIGALVGAAAVTPAMLYAPRAALWLQGFLKSNLDLLSDLSVGNAGDAPWEGLERSTGIAAPAGLAAVLAAACACLGLYLGLYAWLRKRRAAPASAPYALCSLVIVLMPWLIAAGLLLSGPCRDAYLHW